MDPVWRAQAEKGMPGGRPKRQLYYKPWSWLCRDL